MRGTHGSVVHGDDIVSRHTIIAPASYIVWGWLIIDGAM